MLADGRLPECWIPPAHVLEYRALLELYLDLRTEHTAWAQRVHAVLFHQGAAALGADGLRSEQNLARLGQIAATQLTPAGQRQVATALAIMDALDEHLDALRRELIHAAQHLAGARTLTTGVYGVGWITALALCCWLAGTGRFSSSRKAVRFTGLDITVHSSDGKRSPGHLSRQGPPVLRWCLFEAGKAHARAVAPDHGYYAQVKDRLDGKRAALSEARKIVRQAWHILDELGEDALTVT